MARRSAGVIAVTLAQVVDAVILITLAEFAALVVWHRRTGAGVAPREFALNLVSGFSLMLALRSAVHESGMPWVALFLLMAGIAHVADLWRRWVRRTNAVPAGAGFSDAATAPQPPRTPAG